MPKQPAKDDEELSPKEIAERRDNALRRALNTPPKPHVPKSKKQTKAIAKR